MATILLSSAGAAIGSGFGGSVLGLSGAVLGRAIGATAGRAIDQNVLQGGAQAGQSGKIDRFRIPSVGYGIPVQEVWGRMRIAGQIIWASRFLESSQSSGGGKGTRRSAGNSYSYSVSLAVGLCIGQASAVGRVWADGIEIARDSLDMRFYPGSETQLPDAKIEAVEGAGNAPSYRGIAYVVIEELQLARFGNRVPALSFEVIRRANIANSDDLTDLASSVHGVAMIPGSGEYQLATQQEYFNFGPGKNVSANVHSVQGQSDLDVSLQQLNDELPNCKSISLVVCWFGDDLRCGECVVQPKVDQMENDGVRMPWKVSGVDRFHAKLVPQNEGKPVYGGTPTDQSVIQAIQRIRNSGMEVMFYPFILMDQLSDNSLPNPWDEQVGQPKLPWRGRITTSIAPGRTGTPNKTAMAESEIDAFLGQALPIHFVQESDTVSYSGPAGWGYRRFILHYANLCAVAGGVDAFCIGSELRGLTQIQSALGQFPMVSALKALAAEVREILGPNTKISYAADWTEYRGLQSNGDFIFNLDPLWSDENIDFIGIDNYMPLSDWRNGAANADSAFQSPYDINYLSANIAGGEGYDWYYETAEAAELQNRTEIRDIEFGEDWVYKSKDILNWWSHSHHDRVSGVRSPVATDWIPQLKPIRFTEYGCAALNLATNEPNKFIDLYSSESALPRGSNGHRDDYIQSQYLAAISQYWRSAHNNPVSNIYSGPMLDIERSHVWAWDSRPFPDFPGNLSVWSDAKNYFRGHWLNGRAANQTLMSIVVEICESAHLGVAPVFRGISDTVHGFSVESTKSARDKLQTFSTCFGFDVGESDGDLVFFKKIGEPKKTQELSAVVQQNEAGTSLEYFRVSGLENPTKSSLTYVEAENNFDMKYVEDLRPSTGYSAALSTEAMVLLTEEEAFWAAESLLNETVLAGSSVHFSVPLSQMGLSLGDVLSISERNYRIVGIEDRDFLSVDAVRVGASSSIPTEEVGTSPARPAITTATPVFGVFLDLPIIQGSDDPYAPHIAVSAAPWLGSVSVWNSAAESGFTLNSTINSSATVGVTLDQLGAAPSSHWDRGSVVRVKVSSGALTSKSEIDVLNGANIAAIGDGSPGNWEIFQFVNAVLVGEDMYELSLLLRGLSGTDSIGPDFWPAGSLVVLLDSSVRQIEFSSALRGLDRNYRVGVASRGYADQDAIAIQTSFNSIGIRPFSVCQLLASRGEDNSLNISWVRRSRIDGDTWMSADVPLGEESENYLVKVLKNSTILREAEVGVPMWVYSSGMQLDDVISSPFEIWISQVSKSFGPGPEGVILIE